MLPAMREPAASHPWEVSPARAVEIQRELAARVRIERPARAIRYVAGTDAATSVDERDALAAVVLWDVERREVVERRIGRRRLTFPYVPGLLSFREAPAVLAALAELDTEPDALLCDGHGLAHPRAFGVACHVGVLSGLPAVGCAKSRLVGSHGAPGRSRGSRRALRHDGQTVGVVLRTRSGVRPVYVSVGHRIDLDSAIRLVLACGAGFRLPEPLRLADQLAGSTRRGEPVPPWVTARKAAR